MSWKENKKEKHKSACVVGRGKGKTQVKVRYVDKGNKGVRAVTGLREGGPEGRSDANPEKDPQAGFNNITRVEYKVLQSR